RPLVGRGPEPSRVHVRLEARELRDVIVAASELLGPHVGRPPAVLTEALLQRPEGHVGLGEGVSLPHAPIEGLAEPRVALVTTATPLPVDGDHADVFFVLLAPEHDHHAHLRALAHVGRLCHHARLLDQLRAATHADELVEAVASAERAFMRAEPSSSGDRERLLAVIEVAEHDPARIAELVTEGFEAPQVLSSEHSLYAVLRPVLGAPGGGRRLLLLPI